MVVAGVTVPFDDVLVMGSRSIPRDLAREAAPWDLNVLVEYQPEYLSGFRAEVYSIDLEEGFEVARERMAPTLRTAVRQDIGGDHQRIHELTTHHAHIRFKHLLLPFWVAAFRFGRRSFRFVVIDEAFGRGSDESTRYGLELFKKLNLQLLIVTPLQKIHIIEDYIAGVHFVHNEGGQNSMIRNLTVEEYRAEKQQYLQRMGG